MYGCRYYLGRRCPSFTATSSWRAMDPPYTPLLNDPALDSRAAVCELMNRLSLDPHPDRYPDVLSVGCSCEALVARIARELRLRALELPSHLPASSPPTTLSPAIVFSARPLSPLCPASELTLLAQLGLVRVLRSQAPTDKSREQQQLSQVLLPCKFKSPSVVVKSEPQIQTTPPSLSLRSKSPPPPPPPIPTSVRPAPSSLPTVQLPAIAPPLTEPPAPIRKRVGRVQISVSDSHELEPSENNQSNGNSVIDVTLSDGTAQHTTGSTGGDTQSESRTAAVEEPSVAQTRPARKGIRKVRCKRFGLKRSAFKPSNEKCKAGSTANGHSDSDVELSCSPTTSVPLVAASQSALRIITIGGNNEITTEITKAQPKSQASATEKPIVAMIPSKKRRLSFRSNSSSLKSSNEKCKSVSIDWRLNPQLRAIAPPLAFPPPTKENPPPFHRRARFGNISSNSLLTLSSQRRVCCLQTN